MGENLIEFRDGTFVIDGCEVSGITDFTADLEAVEEYVEKNTRFIPEDGVTFVITCKFDIFTLYKLTGFWSWVENNCPNKRIVWLMKHGKSKRIRRKNLNRGFREIGKILKKVVKENDND